MGHEQPAPVVELEFGDRDCTFQCTRSAKAEESGHRRGDAEVDWEEVGLECCGKGVHAPCWVLVFCDGVDRSVEEGGRGMLRLVNERQVLSAVGILSRVSLRFLGML